MSWTRETETGHNLPPHRVVTRRIRRQHSELAGSRLECFIMSGRLDRTTSSAAAYSPPCCSKETTLCTYAGTLICMCGHSMLPPLVVKSKVFKREEGGDKHASSPWHRSSDIHTPLSFCILLTEAHSRDSRFHVLSIPSSHV